MALDPTGGRPGIVKALRRRKGPPLGVRRGRGGVTPGQLYPERYLRGLREKFRQQQEYEHMRREFRQRVRPRARLLPLYKVPQRNRRLPVAPPDTSPFPGLPRGMRPRRRRVIV